VACFLVVASATPYDYFNKQASITARSENEPTEFGMETLISYIPMGGAALSKATSTLDLLMKGFPAVLKNISPSFKSDIRKVNGIVADVCNKIMSEARPSTYSYYSSGGMKATCDSINKIAQEISQGLDDPAITQSYVDKLKGASKMIQDQVDVYSTL
jgi:hypothetical protein